MWRDTLDSYLDIAQKVLRAARRPMGVKAILKVAYDAGVVPKHLHGKTQEKTLQARLSEEILNHRTSSIFFRTEPGQFFLTEFLNDEEIPQEWKVPFPARRRTRDLTRDNTLAIANSFLSRWTDQALPVEAFFEAASEAGALAYMHPDEMADRNFCSVWTFSIAMKRESVLAYRIGRYRDDRDHFAKRRSIGFPGPLAADDASLFATDSVGATDCAVAVLTEDLDLTYSTFSETGSGKPELNFLTFVEQDNQTFIVIVLTWHCPEWFEPTTRRLSLNEPHWLPLSLKRNDLEDFEPWSSQVLKIMTENEVDKEGGD